jgi:chromosome partitioning protein
MIISLLSQKGGVGKSSISRTLAVEFTRSGWKTLLADIDDSQATSNSWAKNRRKLANIKPEIETKVFPMAFLAIEESKYHDLTIIDGMPHSTNGTLDAAAASTLTILPTGTSTDDLETTIKLANELVSKNVDKNKIIFALYKTTSIVQEREAKETIQEHGYQVLDQGIPVKTEYINAFDAGFAATETKIKTLNKPALRLVQLVADKLKELK